MYIDEYYLLIVLPAILLSLIAQWRVKSTFAKYSKVATGRAVTGARAAESILRMNGAPVTIEGVGGNLSDHYDPRSNTIRLSPGVMQSTSIAAVGVAAHEAGHALQYAEGYGPVKLRGAMVPVTSFGSKLALPLIVLGLIMYVPYMYYAGIALFTLIAVFQLITLPVEFNASRRALAALEQSNILDEEERAQAKRVLTAAALTYIAALAVTLAQLLRFSLMGRNRRR